MTGRPDREEWLVEMVDLIVACGVADQLKLRYAYQAHAESISHSDGRRYWERRYLGPSHARCNRATSGRRTPPPPAPVRRRQSRDW